MLNNPFYVGIIRIKTTGEVFQGVHERLVDKGVFDQVDAVLHGRLIHRTDTHRFRYQRTIQCATCNRSLLASRHKGRVYYRCQTQSCPTTCIREDRIDGVLVAAAARFSMTDAEVAAVRADITTMLDHHGAGKAELSKSMTLSLAALDDRLSRLTDAYIDRTIDRETFIARKERLLDERATLTAKMAAVEAGNDAVGTRAEKILELVKALGCLPDLENDDYLRATLKSTTSNLTVDQKNVVVAWHSPFLEMMREEVVTDGGPHRAAPRTKSARIAHIIVEHLLSDRQSPVQ